jgi:hypothetical protein
MAGLFQFAAEFADADAGAQPDLAHPGFEFDVVALAGVVGERLRVDPLDLVHRADLGNPPAHGVIAGHVTE